MLVQAIDALNPPGLSSSEIDNYLSLLCRSYALWDICDFPGPRVMEMAKQRLSEDPNNPVAGFVYGFFFPGSNAERLDFFRQLASKHPRDAQIIRYLGSMYGFNGEVGYCLPFPVSPFYLELTFCSSRTV
jgi:hypothetical protein